MFLCTSLQINKNCVYECIEFGVCSPSLGGLLFPRMSVYMCVYGSERVSICRRLVHCSVIRCVDACGTRVFVLLKELSTTCTITQCAPQNE